MFNKIIIFVVILVILLILLFAYNYFNFLGTEVVAPTTQNQDKPATPNQIGIVPTSTGFRGPTGNPYIKGPTGPPPNSSY